MLKMKIININELKLLLATVLTLMAFPGDSYGNEKNTGLTNDWALPTTEMPLGPSSLSQTTSSVPLFSGVTFYQIKRGAPDPKDFWTVNIGFYPTPAASRRDAATLGVAGLTTRLDPSDGKDTRGQTLGYFLSVGKYASRDTAEKAAKEIEIKTRGNFHPKTRNTALAGNFTTGPWIVNLLAIKPALTTAKFVYALPGGDNLGGDGETVSAAASRLGAIAGINAGFFSNINPFKSPLPPRSPVGLTVFDGRLVSAAVGGRPGAMISTTPDGHPVVKIMPELTSTTVLTAGDNASITVRDINRPILGTVINCGARAEAPVTKPAHDYVCTNFNDLVVYDSLFLRGKSSNVLVNQDYNGLTYELVVNAAGMVLDGHTTLGTAAPQGGYVVQGLGKSAVWLEKHSRPGTRLSLKSHVYSEGKAVSLSPGMSIVESGPLLSAAELLPDAWKEGFSPKINGTDDGDSAGTPNDNWYQGWVVGRNGRTAIGVAADGTILLVEIPGRQPSVSLGTSIPETAAIMSWLGAKSALNLDGGGSSNMVVNGKSVGYPSDESGERGVAGTLMLVPHQ